MGLIKTFALPLVAAMSLASAASGKTLIAAFDINGSTNTAGINGAGNNGL